MLESSLEKVSMVTSVAINQPLESDWLTHCGLVTSYGDKDLGPHWSTEVMACCLMAPSHYLNQC